MTSLSTAEWAAPVLHYNIKLHYLSLSWNSSLHLIPSSVTRKTFLKFHLDNIMMQKRLSLVILTGLTAVEGIAAPKIGGQQVLSQTPLWTTFERDLHHVQKEYAGQLFTHLQTKYLLTDNVDSKKPTSFQPVCHP